MGVTSFLVLSCLCLAITAETQDCSRPVGGPNMSLKGDNSIFRIFPDRMEVSFACDVGYMDEEGSPVVTCTDGSWSPLTLRCERRNCTHIELVNNGIVHYSGGTLVSAKVFISCRSGYRLVGRSELTCGVEGWEGRLPTCEVVTCNPPPAVTFGTFSPDKETYKYREVVQCTCQKDSTLNGSNSTTCSGDGTFQPGPPTCNTTLVSTDPLDNGGNDTPTVISVVIVASGTVLLVQHYRV